MNQIAATESDNKALVDWNKKQVDWNGQEVFDGGDDEIVVAERRNSFL